MPRPFSLNRSWIHLWILVVTLVRPLPAATPDCASCQEPIRNKFVWVDTSAFLEPQPICTACNQIKRRCFECNLPTKTGYTKLKDDRFLCPRHSRTPVLSLHEATVLFRQAQRDVMYFLRDLGPLPENNIQVHLVDRKQLLGLLKQHPAINASLTRGLTQTLRNQDGQFKHDIYLLNGLTPSHTLVVAAHEYTHTCLAENVTRELDGNTIEGFCELIAYKVAKKRNLGVEQKAILANAYSQGQLSGLRKAEDDFRFYELVRWLKEGTTTSVNTANTAEVLTHQAQSPALYHLPSAQKSSIPDQLTLKGISGTPQRRFVLVNDRTLALNEVGKVRVGNSHVVVRCLEITEHSALLQFVDTRKTVRLTLDTRK